MYNVYIHHNSQDLFYRNPFGAVPCGSKIFFRILGENCDEANLELTYFNGERKTITMKKIYGVSNKTHDTPNNINNINNTKNRSEVPSTGDKVCYITCSSDDKNDIYLDYCFLGEIVVEEPGIIEYYFSLRKENQWLYYGNNEEVLGGVGRVYLNNPKPYQVTVYEDFKVPNWYKEGIIYQIFVDSFNKGNYENISDEKNVHSDETIEEYMTEPLKPKKNSFIYGDWYDEPMYIKDSTGNIIRWAFYGGNLQGIIEKLNYLKTLGITIIYLNPIFEASSVHKYDTGDYTKIDSMFGDEEKFKELCEKAREVNIRIILDGVFSHSGADSIYFNKYGNYEEVGAYQSDESIYYKWYSFKNYPEDYECWWGVRDLPNIKELEPSYLDFIVNSKNSVISKWLRLGASGWRLDVADELPDEFIEALRKKVKEIKEDGIIIGEVWEDASNKISYGKKRKYLLGKELDSVMNYPFRSLTIDFFRGYINSKDFIRRIMSLYENYPSEVFYANMNLLGTHDTERLLTIFLEAYKDNAVAVILFKLATLLQITFPGVPCIYYGDEAGLTGGKDPYNRKAYPWQRENMDLLNWYKTITSLRNNYEIFKKGDILFHEIAEDVLCFERNFEEEKAIIIINRSRTESTLVELNFLDERINFKNLISEANNYEINKGVLRITLGTLKYALLISCAKK